MNFECFIIELCDLLSERLYKDESIKRCEVLKNNGVIKNGISIIKKMDNCNASPTIYLEGFYKEYENGEKDLETVAKEIECIYRGNTHKVNFDLESFFDYEKIKDKLVCRIVNRDLNSELLKDTPHESYLDLALIVCMLIKDECIGNASITIKNEHLKRWGISKQELIRRAKDNTRKKMHVKINRIGDVISNMTGHHNELDFADDINPSMYVLTNNENYYGAIFMIYNDIMDGFCQMFNGDALVIPSSVHEVIVLPGDDISIEYANEMIYEVNRSELAIEERLSDHAYLYCGNVGFSV